MSFEKIKKAVASMDAVVVDSNDPEAQNVNQAAASFSGDVFVWTSPRLRFNNRENQPVLKLVDSMPHTIVGNVLVVAKTKEILDCVLAPEPAPKPVETKPPESKPSTPSKKEEDDKTLFSRFNKWDLGE